MITQNKLKIVNDPIYGFISIPHELLYDLIQHPYFQRLRRISQMGLSSLVYPGATHTRFHHALGCLHLMQKAVLVLKSKQVQISEEEELGLYIAILLHDIGHGPFSHAMEESIIEHAHHETLSLAYMESLNEQFNGKLSTAIQIFKGEYSRKFLLQLVSSQLDMDRMDYLKRDSFYSGVAEGSINSDRIIQMLNVNNDELVIEEKGLYSVEKFLVARRLMYWQCYFHKTSIAAEAMLTRVLKRAKELIHQGVQVWATPALDYFLSKSFSEINNEVLRKFALLDDTDIITALKNWQFHSDEILSSLSNMIVNRELLKVKEVESEQLVDEIIEQKVQNSISNFTIEEQKKYFVFKIRVSNYAYDKNKQPILIINKKEEVFGLLDQGKMPHLESLAHAIDKFFVCYPKKNTSI